MVHDCTLVGLSVDTGRLYDGNDPGYEWFLRAAADRIYQTLDSQK